MTPTREQDISRSRLEKFDGKDGRLCYVAVDGIVYEIKDSPLWVDGEHITSGGRAHCGKELSEVINQAPHGKKILQILPIVGELKD
jgi:predicted heme/steroid binding protein